MKAAEADKQAKHDRPMAQIEQELAARDAAIWRFRLFLLLSHPKLLRRWTSESRSENVLLRRSSDRRWNSRSRLGLPPQKSDGRHELLRRSSGRRRKLGVRLCWNVSQLSCVGTGCLRAGLAA
jgi:hypothetical protein